MGDYTRTLRPGMNWTFDLFKPVTGDGDMLKSYDD